MRHFSFLDNIIQQIDRALRLTTQPTTANRPNPGAVFPEPTLTAIETQQVIALMRINHAGEISAQGLYNGQALTARLTHVRTQMEAAAAEEIDHLAWCRTRIEQLNGRVSYLDPLWYLGSFVIGATAGAIGDRWSLGFIAETERQVGIHLQSHLTKLPLLDQISHAILSQMQAEEACHEASALAAGGRALPWIVQCLMRGISKIMVTTAGYF